MQIANNVENLDRENHKMALSEAFSAKEKSETRSNDLYRQIF